MHSDDFADWYGAHWSRVLRAVTIALGDRDLAEEATAEAFARAQRAAGAGGRQTADGGLANRAVSGSRQVIAIGRPAGVA